MGSSGVLRGGYRWERSQQLLTSGSEAKGREEGTGIAKEEAKEGRQILCPCSCEREVWGSGRLALGDVRLCWVYSLANHCQ